MRNINKIHIVLIILFLSLATINSYACIPIPPDGWNDDNDSGDPCDPSSCEYNEDACNGGDCSASDNNDSGDPCDPSSCQYDEGACNGGDCSGLDNNDSGDPCDQNSCQYDEATCNGDDCSALDDNDSGDPCDPTSCQYNVDDCNNCSDFDDNDSGNPCDPSSCLYNVDDCDNCSDFDDNDSGDPCDPSSCLYNQQDCYNCSEFDDNDSGNPCDPSSCQYNQQDCDNPCGAYSAMWQDSFQNNSIKETGAYMLADGSIYVFDNAGNDATTCHLPKIWIVNGAPEMLMPDGTYIQIIGVIHTHPVTNNEIDAQPSGEDYVSLSQFAHNNPNFYGYVIGGDKIYKYYYDSNGNEHVEVLGDREDLSNCE